MSDLESFRGGGKADTLAQVCVITEQQNGTSKENTGLGRRPGDRTGVLEVSVSVILHLIALKMPPPESVNLPGGHLFKVLLSGNSTVQAAWELLICMKHKMLVP